MKRLAKLLRALADRLDPTPLQRAAKIIDEYAGPDIKVSVRPGPYGGNIVSITPCKYANYSRTER